MIILSPYNEKRHSLSDVLVTILDGDAPYGIYLNDDRAAYRALRNAFNGGLTAYRALIETPDAMEDTDLLKANVAAWAALAEAVKGVFQTQSKDLEIFCWYIAALSHRSDPLTQVAEAIASMANLIDEHWDGLQPILPEAKRKGDTDAVQKSQVAELKMRPFAQPFGEAEGAGLLNGPLNYLLMLGNITLATYTTALRGEGVEPLIAQAHESIPTDHEDLTVRIEALQSIIGLVPLTVHSEKMNRDIYTRILNMFDVPQMQNSLRGLWVEAMVCEVLGSSWKHTGGDWAAWDLERQDGLRIEVKQSAKQQSWGTSTSAPRFGIAAAKGHYHDGKTYIVNASGCRLADIYIFAGTTGRTKGKSRNGYSMWLKPNYYQTVRNR